MILIPAIDIQGGRCVQLRQGVKQSASVYGDDPVAMAQRWIALGARRLHVVDLDGAFAGKRVNASLVGGIAAAAGDVPVQVGGGIRTLEEIESYLHETIRTCKQAATKRIVHELHRKAQRNEHP